MRKQSGHLVSVKNAPEPYFICDFVPNSSVQSYGADGSKPDQDLVKTAVKLLK